VDPNHFLADDLTRIEFVRGYGSTVDGLILRQGDYFVEADRVRPPGRGGPPR